MDGIVLRGNRYSGNTIVSNYFIDDYMSDANGAQLKVYLFLMRCIEADEPVSVTLIADKFNYTETDIKRSLLYWARKGIVTLEFDEEDNLSGILLNDPAKAVETDVTLPKKKPAKKQPEKVQPEVQQVVKSVVQQKPAYSTAELANFSSQSEIKELVFVAEQYLARPLTPTDMRSMLFIYDKLGFSEELIEYLIEYCVCKGKTSMRYIEQTALNWADAGVNTVEEAKGQIKTFAGGDHAAVLKAFGITDRKPAAKEIEYIDIWKNEYGFSMEIILEAVGRSIMRTAKPSFEYTDRILKSWAENGVHTMADIENLDEAFASRAQKGARVMHGSFALQAGRSDSGTAGSASNKKATNNKVHFNLERQYDFDKLEAKLLKRQRL
ncbi:MAG: DnaD domain protein [Lachnospiraceae bacterium]|nr:DnaD domain protein [Lachnospiraceae bacterium]